LVTLFNPNASTTLANVTAVGQPENQEYYATDTVTLDKEYPKTPICKYGQLSEAPLDVS
jgi:hypothetical protein